MDTIANLLTIIRNGYGAKKRRVLVPYSKFAQAILKILVKERYVDDFKVIKNKFKKFEIYLKYQDGKAAFLGIKKVSKPGRRIYRGSKKIPATPTGRGLTIVSTSSGVMSNLAAKKKNLGGEVICHIF